jgi:hypothetical protein
LALLIILIEVYVAINHLFAVVQDRREVKESRDGKSAERCKGGGYIAYTCILNRLCDSDALRRKRRRNYWISQESNASVSNLFYVHINVNFTLFFRILSKVVGSRSVSSGLLISGLPVSAGQIIPSIH